MAEVKWIKIVTDIFDDEKILLIENIPEADSIIVIWFKLLCMAGKQNNNGIFMLNDKIPYTDEMLATICRRPLCTVRSALSIFEKLGMIEIVNNVYTITNWVKHQNLEVIQKQKEQNRLRVAAYRDRKKAEIAECNAYGNVTVMERNAADKDIERDLEKDNIKENSVKENGVEKIPPSHKTASRFTQPTLEEVKSYCAERKNGVDAQRFYDYYTANGWKVGRNTMKDWKAAVRTWERKDKISKEFEVDNWWDR